MALMVRSFKGKYVLPPALGLGYPRGVQLGALNKQLIIKYFLLEKYEIGQVRGHEAKNPYVRCKK